MSTANGAMLVIAVVMARNVWQRWSELTPTLNLFSKVQVNALGQMHYVPGNSQPGSVVELRAEMKVLVLANANHHPMEPGKRRLGPGLKARPTPAHH